MTFKKNNKVNEIDFLAEFAVWGHLHSTTDLELLLLKGHLLLEIILDTVLSRNDINNPKNYSFYKKIKVFEEIDFEDRIKKNYLVSFLKRLNKLRNNIAHEFSFDIKNVDLESLALEILQNLNGEKFTRYTYRTKIVHSFSVLSINILELTDRNTKTTANNVYKT